MLSFMLSEVLLLFYRCFLFLGRLGGMGGRLFKEVEAAAVGDLSSFMYI